MANIIVNKCVNKDSRGGYSVTDSHGRYLGHFKNKDYAMERLWQVDDHKKARKERMERR